MSFSNEFEEKNRLQRMKNERDRGSTGSGVETEDLNSNSGFLVKTLWLCISHKQISLFPVAQRR